MRMSRPALSLGGLACRSLAHHQRASLFVLLAAATAAAVITGALLVGDSVRGSLEDRARERLGGVGLALAGGRLLREELAADLAGDPRVAAGVRAAVPALLVRGTAADPDSGRRAAGVNVLGVPAAFWDLWAPPGAPPGVKAAWSGRRAAVNARLAEEVGVRPGGTVLVHLEKPGDVPAEHALGRRGANVQALRVDVEHVLPDAGLALFDLRIGQETPRNVFLPLDLLQRVLKREGLANAVLVEPARGDGDAALLAALGAALQDRWQLEDAGLRLRVDAGRGHASLESRELLLPAAAAEAARAAARDLGCETLDVLTYLANTIRAGGREVPYSTITAAGAWEPSGAPAFPEIGPAARGTGWIALNDWAADDLGAAAGDEVTIAYYKPAAGDRLQEAAATFRLASTVRVRGPAPSPAARPAADPGWTPEYPGISDARSLRDWDPPFPMDLGRIRDADEDYWDEHRATPKAFISLEDGRRLWASRFGDLTSIRIRPRPGDPEPIEEVAAKLQERILAVLAPARLGLSFRAVKLEAVAAARQGTDFGGLFLGLSFFLIASALILLQMLFRLACEGRARELGLLAAVGFPERAVRGILLREGAALALSGAAVGAAGGVAYAAALMAGLRTWWKDAVNAPFLALHATPRALLVGAGATAVLAVLTLAWTARGVARIPPRRLLSGAGISGPGAGAGRRRGLAGLLAAAVLAAGAMAFLAAGLSGGLRPEIAFFACGGLLLGALLALIDSRLRRPGRAIAARRGPAALIRLGASQAGLAPGRSLLTAALIASATFIIVAVAASRRAPGSGAPERGSGDGGFALAARPAVPLTASLSTPEGREALGMLPETSALLDRSRLHAFRLRPGDDASCLNLYRPASPRVLGAPPGFIERGGFAWAGSQASSDAERENPWLLLEKDLPDGAVPAIGDANTVTWILHSGLGRDLTLADDHGREVKLRFVALLSHSIFQGELIVSGTRFAGLFPSSGGDGFLLFETPPADAGPLEAALEKDLAGHGMDVRSTAALLADYAKVENTYLSTFQVLGGLGLLLGTAGLGAVLLRNVNERRGEIAVLQAMGYSKLAISSIVASETVLLLSAGLLAGTISAVVAVLPGLRSGSTFSWAGLAGALALVLAAGMISSAAALRSALAAPLIPSLRRE
jgi:ABC-type lipoprotein release transport system permease subunit